MLYKKFVNEYFGDDGRLERFEMKRGFDFNFGFDVVDELGRTKPDKLAMLWVSNDGEEKRFTFSDMMRLSSKAANFFTDIGIRKGDRVMLVLKRHYQFWIAIVALHKIGAIVVPATHLLTKKDYVYRFNAAGIKGIVCTSDNGVTGHVAESLPESPTLELKIVVGSAPEGWYDFNKEIEKYPDVFERVETLNSDPMIMYFTSGTSGYPKAAVHDYTYPIGHIVTARYWHNVDPDGLHFTVADTGWGKAVWGKLYGQWLCEAAVFTYDFDRFDGNSVLSMIEK